MSQPRKTTRSERTNRLWPALAAGLLLTLIVTVIGGRARQYEPVPASGAGAPSAEVPSSEMPSSKNGPAKPTRIIWEKSFESALAKAKASGKPIMIDFYAVWCGPCKMLDEETYTAPEVIAESANFINVKVDGEKRRDLERRYNVYSYPTIILTDSSGKPIELLDRFAPAAPFVEFMRSGLTKHMVAFTA